MNVLNLNSMSNRQLYILDDMHVNSTHILLEKPHKQSWNPFG